MIYMHTMNLTLCWFPHGAPGGPYGDPAEARGWSTIADHRNASIQEPCRDLHVHFEAENHSEGILDIIPLGRHRVFRVPEAQTKGQLQTDSCKPFAVYAPCLELCTS